MRKINKKARAPLLPSEVKRHLDSIQIKKSIDEPKIINENYDIIQEEDLQISQLEEHKFRTSEGHLEVDEPEEFRDRIMSREAAPPVVQSFLQELSNVDEEEDSEYDEDFQRFGNNAPHKSKSKAAILLIMISIIILVGVGIGIYYGIRNGKNLPDKPIRKELEYLINSIVTEEGAPGVVFYVVFQNGNEINITNGYSNRDKHTNIGIEDKFRIGDITMLFSATAIFQLIQNLSLKLHDFLGQYLDKPSEKKLFVNITTIEEALHHMTKIKDYFDYGELVVDSVEIEVENTPKKYFPIDHLLDNSAYIPYEENFLFSHTNYLLLGNIIENVTNDSFYSYIEKHILTTQGLNNTSIPRPNTTDLPRPFSEGYKRINETEYNTTTEVNPSYFLYSGEMISTSKDLVHFLQNLLGGKIIIDELLYKMLNFSKVVPHKSQHLPFFIDTGIGLGLWNVSGLIGSFSPIQMPVPGYSSYVFCSSLRQEYCFSLLFNVDERKRKLRPPTFLPIEIKRILDKFIENK